MPLFSIFVLSAFWLGGCASYQGGSRVNLQNDQSEHRVAAENHSVALAAKPVHEVEDLKTHFGGDTLEYGILPVQLGMTNISTDTTLLLDPRDISVVNPEGDSMGPMTLEQVMSYTSKSYGRSVGWGIAFGVIGAAASAANVHNTNNKMRADYDAKMLKFSTLAPGSNADGVAFFKVPKEIESLDGWKVTAKAVDTKGTSYPIDVGLKGTVEKRKSNDANTDEEDASNVH